MNRSFVTCSPVISLLSSSPAASRRAQDLLATTSLFGMEPLPPWSNNMKNNNNDELGTAWDSVACKCPSSGAILHFLSVVDNRPKQQEEESRLSLLAVTGKGSTTSSSKQDDFDLVRESRSAIAKHIETHGQPWKLSLTRAFGGTVSPFHILGRRNQGLPILQHDVPETCGGKATNSFVANGLKEVCIPYLSEARYKDGSTLSSQLASLHRPVVGLYQWNKLAIRPLPSAPQDLSLPPLTLVFHCNNNHNHNDDMMEDELNKAGIEFFKIGYNGTGQTGQTIVQQKQQQQQQQHDPLGGLEIRLCSSNTYKSSFCEAQDALLASSLDDLQRPNNNNDDVTKLGDCWMEVRANMKQPHGFLKRQKSSTSGARSPAKAPDLPFE